mmetsp:Transcript_56592/g.168398  ORF Transcript_56592/g.168398 Transcript_56592/m.168398 type:complete len:353 (-) Transcript_56592:321-1379(-)
MLQFLVDLDYQLQDGRLPADVASLLKQSSRMQEAVKRLLGLATGLVDLPEQLHRHGLASPIPSRTRELDGLLGSLHRLLEAFEQYHLECHPPQRKEFALCVARSPGQLLLLTHDIQCALGVVDLDNCLEERGYQVPEAKFPRHREGLVQRLQRQVNQAFGLVGAGDNLVGGYLPEHVAVLPALCHCLLCEAARRLGIRPLRQHDAGHLLLGGSLAAHSALAAREVGRDLGEEVGVLVLLLREVQLRNEQKSRCFLASVADAFEKLQGLLRQLQTSPDVPGLAQLQAHPGDDLVCYCLPGLVCKRTEVFQSSVALSQSLLWALQQQEHLCPCQLQDCNRLRVARCPLEGNNLL